MGNWYRGIHKDSSVISLPITLSYATPLFQIIAFTLIVKRYPTDACPLFLDGDIIKKGLNFSKTRLSDRIITLISAYNRIISWLSMMASLTVMILPCYFMLRLYGRDTLGVLASVFYSVIFAASAYTGFRVLICTVALLHLISAIVRHCLVMGRRGCQLCRTHSLPIEKTGEFVPALSHLIIAVSRMNAVWSRVSFLTFSLLLPANVNYLYFILIDRNHLDLIPLLIFVGVFIAASIDVSIYFIASQSMKDEALLTVQRFYGLLSNPRAIAASPQQGLRSRLRIEQLIGDPVSDRFGLWILDICPMDQYTQLMTFVNVITYTLLLSQIRIYGGLI